MAVRLTDRQAAALEELDPSKWIGAWEGGPSGNTIEALAAKALVSSKWVAEPHWRLVGRLTAAGVAERDRRRPRVSTC